MSIYRIRTANPFDPARLPDIELAAARLFRDYFDETGLSEGAIKHTNSVDDFRKALTEGLLWVVVDQRDIPVGFALARRCDAVLHVHELDVHPAHARRGLGRMLLEHVRDSAAERGISAITLTTYRNVPWNAPYYQRIGFRILDDAELTHELRTIFEGERALGWKVDARVAMRLDLNAER